ncbi:MAG: sugar ABC transporter ATP-binding protein [Lachnospiraceae bacterium]|nr:sugar ABC transporter ATP-binding protein [Lachnospiraceae bacterium]
MKNIVRINNMYKSFYGAMALNGMDFSMNEGEIRCLIGENGCGKSTMIKVISGFHPFDSGELYINEKAHKKISPSESIAEGIQVIYQDFSLFPNMTIAENIMMYSTVAEKKAAVRWKRIRERAVEILKKVQFEIDPDIYVEDLNVAQKQMVAICRAIVQDAKLLIMDEPTTALTTKEVDRLFEIVRRLKQEGVSVLFVSHKLDEVSAICDSFTIMRNGKNVFQSDQGEGQLSKEDMVYYMTGKKFASETHVYKPVCEIPALKLKNLSLEGAFQDISFSLFKGEVLGITGLLGCGRSELAESLFGLKAATGGEIEISGKSVGVFHKVDDALKNGIAYVPEDRLTEGLHLEQSIADNVISRIVRNYANRFGILRMGDLKKKQKESLGSMSVAGMIPENPANSLSGGNQQKIVLIKWLASNPDILILNCPTVGVDVGAKSDIHRIIRNLASEKGVAVIVVSNDIYEIMQTCNRVLVMKDGRISSEVAIGDTTMDELEAFIAAD